MTLDNFAIGWPPIFAVTRVHEIWVWRALWSQIVVIDGKVWFQSPARLRAARAS